MMLAISFSKMLLIWLTKFPSVLNVFSHHERVLKFYTGDTSAPGLLVLGPNVAACGSPRTQCLFGSGHWGPLHEPPVWCLVSNAGCLQWIEGPLGSSVVPPCPVDRELSWQ